MSEYTEVEQPFLQQLAQQGWQIIDQGQGVPQDPGSAYAGTFVSSCYQRYSIKR